MRLALALTLALAACAPAAPPVAQGPTPPAAPAEPPLPARPEAEIKADEAVIAERTRGLSPAGVKVTAKLEAFTPLELPIARGRCYRVIVRQGPRGALGDVKLRAVMEAGGEVAATAGLAQPSSPGAPAGLQCPLAAGKMRVSFVDRASFAPVIDAGKGEVTVELHAIEIAEADLKAADAKAAELRESGARAGQSPCSACEAKCRAVELDCDKRCLGDRRDPASRATCDRACAVPTNACEVLCRGSCQ